MLPSRLNHFKILVNFAVIGLSINQSDDNWICLSTMRSFQNIFDAPLTLSLVSMDSGATELTQLILLLY